MAEDIKSKFLRVVDDAWNQGNLEVLDDLHTQDFILHHPPFDDRLGLDAHKQSIVNVRAGFPDFHLTIHKLVFEEGILALRWTWKGTHSSNYPEVPIPPTGKQVMVSGSHFLLVEDGKLTEGWQSSDNLGFLRQLGVIPTPV